MSTNTLIEVFGHIVFSFTRGVTEHYNPGEPGYTAESFACDPLQSTGREWNYYPVDELIYQEYSDREATSSDCLADSSLSVRVIDACSPEEDDEIQDGQQDLDREMAWKRLRPSAVRTVCKSMYIGALISLLAATATSSLFMLFSYLHYETVYKCLFHSKDTISIQMQWISSMSRTIFSVFLYIWFFLVMLFLFRPHQLLRLKKKLFLVSLLLYCLYALYCAILQALDISVMTELQKIPLRVFFLISICWQVYLVSNHFSVGRSRKQRATLFLQLILPIGFGWTLFCITRYAIFPEYKRQNKEKKILIATFSPLIGVALKVISRISVQRMWHITHPGYSYVLLTPLYFGSAVVFRVLQVDLDSLQSMAILGIIHGVAEVIERSTMVVIDHICHVIWKRRSAPWGIFRTPRCERLMADIAIMSMLSESTSIVSCKSVLYLYQFIYIQNESFVKLLQSFAIQTSVLLVIEWFFTSLSLAIETHYQNMAVMAVWRRRWKRHILVAIINAVALSVWLANSLLIILSRHHSISNRSCKMPFT